LQLRTALSFAGVTCRSTASVNPVLCTPNFFDAQQRGSTAFSFPSSLLSNAQLPDLPAGFVDMSVLPPEVHNALTVLLTALQSPDNVLRTQAEEQLNAEWVQPRPEILLMALVEQILGSEEVGVSRLQSLGSVLSALNSLLSRELTRRSFDSQTRSFAAVLFRRTSTKTRKDPGSELAKETFLTIAQAQRNVIREKLLQAMTVETMAMVRNKVSDAVAEIARQYTEDGEYGR
jgi:hypothetical protein